MQKQEFFIIRTLKCGALVLKIWAANSLSELLHKVTSILKPNIVRNLWQKHLVRENRLPHPWVVSDIAGISKTWRKIIKGLC